MQTVDEGATVWIFAPPTWVVADECSGVLALFLGDVGVYSARDHTFLATDRMEAAEHARQRVAAGLLDHILAHDFSMAWSEVYFTKALVYLASSHATDPGAPFDMEACAQAHAALWGMHDTTLVELCGYGGATGKFLKATRARDAEVPERLRNLVGAKRRRVTSDASQRDARRPPLRLRS